MYTLEELHQLTGVDKDHFERPLNLLRYMICVNSPAYYNHSSNLVLVSLCNDIHRFERYDTQHHIERNESRWERIRNEFFGDEIPEGWNWNGSVQPCSIDVLHGSTSHTAGWSSATHRALVSNTTPATRNLPCLRSESEPARCVTTTLSGTTHLMNAVLVQRWLNRFSNCVKKSQTRS